MQTKMKVVSLGRTAARVFAAAVVLLGAFSCAAPRYIALLPELQRDGATAIAFDAQVSRATLKTNAAFPDNGLSRRADRNIADALLDNGFFRTDTVRLLSTLPETLSGNASESRPRLGHRPLPLHHDRRPRQGCNGRRKRRSDGICQDPVE